MIPTIVGVNIDTDLLINYLRDLINHFFKILPLKESEEKSLPVYIRSLQVEILGSNELIPCFNQDSSFLSLAAILQFLLDNPDTQVSEVKREVFKAISICEKLHKKYLTEGGAEV